MIGCLTLNGLNACVYAKSSEFTLIGNRTDWNEDEIIGREKTRLEMGVYKWNGEMHIPYAFAQ